MRSLRGSVPLVFLACVAVWSALPATVGARTFHVSPHGSNTPPFDTYAKAATDPRSAIDSASRYGDTVFIHTGQYDIDTTIDVALGGVLVGDRADSVVLRWHPGLRTFNWALSVAGDNAISGIGFLADQTGFARSGPPAIFMSIGTGFLRIDHCRFVGMGIDASSTGNREVFQNYFHLQSSEGCVASGLGVFSIHHNVFFGGVGQEGGGAVGIQARESPTLIHDNVFDFSRTETRGTSIDADKSFKPVLVRNNLMIGGGAPILWFYTDGVIENNTIVGPHNPYPIGHALFYQSERDTLVIRNNVFFQMTHLPVFGNYCPDCPNTGRITYTHNAFWPPVDSFYQLDPDAVGKVWLVAANNVNAYPMFVGDSTYRLQWASPLIDAGDPGLLDPDGSRSDVGWTGGPGGQTYAYPELPPSPPDSIWVVGSVGSRVIHVTWSARPEADLAGYRLYRGTMPGFWSPGQTPIRTLLPRDTSAADTVWTGNGSYFYVVTAYDTAGLESGPSPEGQFLVTGVAGDPAAPPLPLTPYIVRTYPNPTNAAFVVEVFIPDVGAQPTPVTITICNAVGQLSGTAYDGTLTPGQHSLDWEAVGDGGTPLASGVYFARLKVWGREFGAATKLVIVR